jgi:hypothetical protein
VLRTGGVERNQRFRQASPPKDCLLCARSSGQVKLMSNPVGETYSRIRAVGPAGIAKPDNQRSLSGDRLKDVP